MKMKICSDGLASRGLIDVHVIMMFCLLFTHVQHVDGGKKNKGKNSETEQTEAIERLSRVFGIEHAPDHSVRAIPPQFMLELFNDITDSGGLIRKDGPYKASTIVSFPDRAYNKESHYYYNVSMQSHEKLIESEFHLFRMTPVANRTRRSSRLSHLIEIKVYQVLSPDTMHSPEGRLLLDHKKVSAHVRGWLIFNVTKAVKEWAGGMRENYGFLVVSQTIFGEELGESEVRFAQRKAHHDSKQPILVLYSDDGKERSRHYISPQDQEYKEITKDIKRQERKLQRRKGKQYRYDNIGLQTAIRYLNEKDREEYGHPFFVSDNKKGDTENLSRRKRNTQEVRRSRRTKKGRKSREKGKRDIEPRFTRHRRSCSRRQLYVDFDEIGWAGWIISPKGYNAYHCKGECPFPLGQSQKPTNHATVQSIVHALRVGKGVSTPCCVPNKLYSISLLYFDDAENVILKQYDDMVAASCGCH